ncbi:DNA repair-scaffolding protein isoform X1 [Tiliqua scincoides]|uniref:DNA repair-scaffolding protein isoform X1 n=1 Tax=Tiliqua scincoides TaxID=71010 RepID=UPI003462EC02
MRFCHGKFCNKKAMKTISIEISEYSSDSEKLEDRQAEAETSNLEFSKKFKLSFGEGVETDAEKSASDWLKTAQAFLQTPKKKAVKSLRTPEDSGKKRKLMRGGLAERLNRLQNRERAAISFWRHQCISNYQAPSGGKTGILIVKILEMHEECNLYITDCQQLGQICADSPAAEEIFDTHPRLKVLFAKETLAHLKGAPQDIIHIHPPWQKLLLNGNLPVIMNTYFSQKILLEEPSKRDRASFQEPFLTKRNVSLAQIFRLSDLKHSQCQASAVNQVSCFTVKSSTAAYTHSNSENKLSPFAIAFLSDSLLDIVETQGTAGGRGMQVQVVVQRVYYLPAKESFRCYLQGNNPAPNTIPLLNSDLPNVRLCVLVQDIYGIFSEVQFQELFSSPEQIKEHSKTWEGKCCHLSGIKILQRVTRGRMLGLFSLIDSLWPPRLPLKVPGQSQENEMHVTTNLSPPSFCYILTAHPEQRHTEANEVEQISNLYFPPAVHSLKEILQMSDQCCSFWAYVIFQRLKVTNSPSLNQRQFWLFVTDSSLQNEAEVSPGTPKTLPVCVASSCEVDVEVTEAVKNTHPCAVFFKDALCGNGRIICIERTVLLLQKPLLCSAAGSDITELTGPVKLDELDSATLANSVCTVRGTIAGIDERTAFSWPTCNRCGNGKVEQHPQDRELLYCNQCCETIISPVLKMHLEVFLHCQSRPLCTVKIKLLQKTIALLLNSLPSEDGRYEVKSVLGKEVGFLYCYVHSITSHPSSYVGLEEIVLPDAGRN